jgi:hypothetical protein
LIHPQHGFTPDKVCAMPAWHDGLEERRAAVNIRREPPSPPRPASRARIFPGARLLLGTN